MASEKSPAFQFYPKDFLTDGNVAGMSLPERGAYITLLCLCWQEQSLPDDPQKLARMVGISKAAFTKLWPALSQCFAAVDGRLSHKRLDEERQKQEAFRQRQAERARRTPAGHEPEASRKPAEVKPEPSRNEAGTKPDTSSSISDLLSSKREREERASLSPAAPKYADPKTDPFLDREVTTRAGAFVDRYQQIYQQRRNGARYAVRPVRDYAAAVTLCQTWPDDRLDKLAAVFLTSDHRFAEEGSRTIPQFLALASWCDSKLTEWEAKHGAVEVA